MNSKAHNSIQAAHKRLVDRGVIVSGAQAMQASGATLPQIVAVAALGEAERIHAEYLRRSKAGNKASK